MDTDFGIPFAGTVLERARWTSPFVRGRFEWTKEFGRTAPRVVDVGCGNGRFLIASAVARPGHDHLGLELVAPLAERAAKRAGQRGLANLRVASADAVEWLSRASDLDEIHVYHPQPYLDPAEAGLGMVSPLFFERVWRALKAGGLLVLQTDDRALGKYLFDAVRKHFDAESVDGPWPDAPEGRTRREIQARRKRRRIVRIRAVRRDAPFDVDVPTAYFDRPNLRKRRSRAGR